MDSAKRTLATSLHTLSERQGCRRKTLAAGSDYAKMTRVQWHRGCAIPHLSCEGFGRSVRVCLRPICTSSSIPEQCQYGYGRPAECDQH